MATTVVRQTNSEREGPHAELLGDEHAIWPPAGRPALDEDEDWLDEHLVGADEVHDDGHVEQPEGLVEPEPGSFGWRTPPPPPPPLPVDDAAASSDNAYTSYQSLLTLIRATGSTSDETRGGCRKCGRVGHLTFQCRNFLSGSASLSSPVPAPPPFLQVRSLLFPAALGESLTFLPIAASVDEEPYVLLPSIHARFVGTSVQAPCLPQQEPRHLPKFLYLI
ncbi:hypothetical protein OsI_31439 [Oryza sativa Indica Group]|uniref:CCHC-type domain-containing protein n=1 Tax=Oryza sativa subsp. indica TaxID=39946 RepID=A2Z1F7_ORYSI|nr:hypothetical protein OsI_31439 [Oryza sativa Indica Group]